MSAVYADRLQVLCLTDIHGTVYLVNLRSRRAQRILRIPTAPGTMGGEAYLDQARRRLVVVRRSPPDVTIRDLARPKVVRERVDLGDRPLTSWCVGSDGSLLAVRNESGRVVLWDLATGRRLGSRDIDAPVECYQFSGDRQSLILAQYPTGPTLIDGAVTSVMIMSVDVPDLRIRTVFERQGRGFIAVTASRDGRIIVGSDFDGSLVFLASRAGERHTAAVRWVHASTAAVNAVDDEGMLVASAGRSDRVGLLWEARTGRMVEVLGRCSARPGPRPGGPSR